MLENAKKVLNIITTNGFKAYIVGGFVRDYLLGIESNDIDITTNATPKELQKIFDNACIPSTDYGAVTLMNNGTRYEITTFRREINYIDNRKPIEIEYIDDLYQDLLRRDFTVNTICMDKDGEIIDFLNGRDDLEKKVIRTVGNAKEKFEQDSLRILRAIRFATNLGFSLEKEVESAIITEKHYLSNLSYNRKKEELDKIFSNKNVKKGIDMLLKFNLDKELELVKLKEVVNTDSLIGVWSILNVVNTYPFNNNEKDIIRDVNIVLNLNNLDPTVLYKYGLYVNQVAGTIKGIDKKKVTEAYTSMIIHSRKELDINSEEIMSLLNKDPGEYLKDIYNDIEKEVLYKRLKNDKKDLIEYIKNKY